MKTTRNHLRRRSPGMTLTELLVSIAIVSILSVGATNLVIAGLRIDRTLLDSNRQVSEMELATRRMLHNIRTGSLISVTGTNVLTLTSQPDASAGGQTYAITYTYDSSAQTLTESSTQFGSPAPNNVVAYNVTSFSVIKVSAAPCVISIDMTIAGSNTAPPTRRAFQILNRNS